MINDKYLHASHLNCTRYEFIIERQYDVNKIAKKIKVRYN